MTIEEYIKDKIQKFGIFQVSDSDILDICEANSFVASKDVITYSLRQREIAIVRYAPQLLLSLDSITEDGFAASRANTESRIKSYVASKCRELGIEDLLNGKSRISNGSNRW